MSWVLVSLILFISSVVLYLSIRWAQLLGAPNQLQNLVMFAVPSAFFLFLITIIKEPLNISLGNLLLIIFAAVFLSYLGSVFSLESVRLAPNPGYSLMISKSYVILTTIVAVVLFHAELNLKGVLAIALIVVGSVLISLPKDGLAAVFKRGFKWVLYAFGAFFCWGGLALISKYVLGTRLNVFVYLFYLTLFVTVLIILEMIVQKVHLTASVPNAFVALTLVGISSTVFNLSMQYGYVISPNIGYINATNASSISVVTLFSVLFFKDNLSFGKFVGIVISTVGLILLFV